MLQKAYGESTLSKTRSYEWFSAFKSGRDVVEDLPRSDRPSTSSTEVNVTKVEKMVSENRNFSLRKIDAELSVSALRFCVAARLVPKYHLTRLSL